MKKKFVIELELNDDADVNYISRLIESAFPNTNNNASNETAAKILEICCTSRPTVTPQKDKIHIGSTPSAPVISAEGVCVLMVEQIRRKVYVADCVVKGFKGDGIYDGKTWSVLTKKIVDGIKQGELDFDTAPIDLYAIHAAMPVTHSHVQTYMPLVDGAKVGSDWRFVRTPDDSIPHEYPVEKIEFTDEEKNAILAVDDNEQ